MRILHILSQTELTGAESYAIKLADRQIQAGHEVWIVSDRLHLNTQAHFIPMPISRRNWRQRISNVVRLRSLLRDKNIDVVHAHSRASSWVAYWASWRRNNAYVSTVHGRQHLHLSLKYYDVYGDRVIAICENIRDHLIRQVGTSKEKIHLLRNGFAFTNLKKPSEQKKLFLVGRTSGPKGARTAHFIKNILERFLVIHPDLEVLIAGGPLKNFDDNTCSRLTDLRTRYGNRLQIRELLSRDELQKCMNTASVVVASGRLAIEALELGKKVVALGEACTHGLVTKDNFADALRTNFGDVLADKEQNIAYNLLEEGITRALTNPEIIDLESDLHKNYHLDLIYQKMEKIYLEALYQRRIPRIPVLMYHKIVNEDYSSDHKTYISTDNFSKHLQVLKNRGCHTLVFSEIEKIAKGEMKAPKKPVILTFDDGYVGAYERGLPLLKQHGFRAVFYVLGNEVQRQNDWDSLDEESQLISTDQIKALREAGMEIGAHSMTHRKLTELNEDDKAWEIRESKKNIEQLLGEKIVSFAYPFGNLCEKSKAIVQECGFQFAVATDSGGLRLNQDPMQIFRTSVFPHDNAIQIRKKISPLYRGYYRLKRKK